MGTGFYGTNDPTNSVKALKEQIWYDMTYNVFGGTLIKPYSINLYCIIYRSYAVAAPELSACWLIGLASFARIFSWRWF